MSKLELVKVKTAEATYKRKPVNLPAYDVVLDGEVIGQVKRALVTRERRSPGRRYVDARWQSPGWRYSDGGRYWDCDSRRDGIERLLRERGLSWTDAEKLAATAKNVR